MRRRLLEHIHPVAQHTPILPGASDLRLAFDHHQNDLPVACHLGSGIACPEPMKRKPDIAPTGTFRGDLMHLASGAKGFPEKIGHIGPHVWMVRPERPQMSMM